MVDKASTFRGYLLGLMLLLGCAAKRTVDVPTLQVPWEPFYWIRATTDSAQFEHTAMLFHLQVRRVGAPSLVQLDLAGSGNMPHGFPRPARDFKGMPDLGRGELYGLLGASVTRALLDRGTDTLLTNWQSRQIGTVGLLNYLNSVLLIDFPKRRLAALPPNISWESLLGASVVTVEIVREPLERLLIPIGDGTGRTYRALFDTGLSPFAVWTTQEIWQDLTGLGGPGPETRTYRLPNPRGGMTFIGARLRRRLRAGTWDLSTPEIVYMAQGPTGAPLEQWAQPVDMVLGPSSLARGSVVAIDLKQHRLGFAKQVAP